MIESGILIGPFMMDQAGGLSLREPGGVANFAFAWRGRQFAAQLDEEGLRLTARLGRVPSSLAGADRRAEALSIARGMSTALPSGWLVRLTADHQLEFAHNHGLALPVAPDELMVPVTRLLLSMQPYLDLLDEAGIDPPESPSMAGNANVCPG